MPLKTETSQFRLAAADRQGPIKLIERLRRQVARELSRPVGEIDVISCYEAGYDGFWLHHLLEAHGCAIMSSMPRACW
jgi:transposase